LSASLSGLSSILACGTSLSEEIPSLQSRTVAKPQITAAILGTWPRLRGGTISNDGKYFSYGESASGSDTVVVQATDSGWKRDVSVAYGAFSADSSQFIFLQNDALCLVTLGTDDKACVQGVDSYKLVDDWLAYRLNTGGRELVLRDLAGGREWRYAGVTKYWLSGDGASLVLQTSATRGSERLTDLKWVALSNMSVDTIWSATSSRDSPVSLNLEASTTQLTFSVTEKAADHESTSIWYYRAGTDKAIRKVSDSTVGIPRGLGIGSHDAPRFVGNGRYIVFTLEYLPVQAKADGVKVDVWSYRDQVLQDAQLSTPDWERDGSPFAAVVDTLGNTVTTLTTAKTSVDDLPAANGDFAIVKDKDPAKYWQIEAKSYAIVSMANGSRTVFKTGYLDCCFLSPTSRFVVYYDVRRKSWFSYEIASKRTRELSAAFRGKLERHSQTEDYQNDRYRYPSTLGSAIWLKDGSAVLVEDDYDVWKLDPTGVAGPVNITNGYGKLHHIRLDIPDSETWGSQKTDEHLLAAYDTSSQDSGYYLKMGIGKGDPELLAMRQDGSFMSRPQKARDAERWVVELQSATEAPNYFITSDLKTYRRLTDVNPQKAYQWLTAELMSWRQLSGKTYRGILYKPDDFDPKKKYPIIFNYYEQKSQTLYDFIYPDYSGGNLNINIPWFVSRGYLVFCPDIAYAPGNPGPSALDAVASAARHFSHFPWIDSSRMGLDGYSWGSYETNYIITHSGQFAAAVSANGQTDMLSFWGQVPGFDSYTEIGQGRMGTSPWGALERYRANSPISRVDRVSTPVLLLYNKADRVNFGQGLEFFKGLRRLNKKAWMLQYDDGGHSLDDHRAAADFTTRMTQFFDHYLQGAPAPKWMTEGVPARLKGIETGLELDTSGREP
jgi:dipeptidyl aminopeptidase/acylaminoacyl peptidase